MTTGENVLKCSGKCIDGAKRGTWVRSERGRWEPSAKGRAGHSGTAREERDGAFPLQNEMRC